jgi:hypothetical protein
MRSLWWTCVVAWCAAIPSHAGHAQNNLPSSVVAAPAALTPDQIKQIDDYVKSRLPGLSDEKDPERVRRMRNELTQPLLESAVGVPFRLEYEKILAKEKLSDLCVSKSELTAINSLRIAGELATSDSFAMLLKGLDDKRLSVRYSAVFGLSRAFEQISPASRGVACPPGTVTAGVTRISDFLKSEKEPMIVDALSRALVAASKVDKTKYEDVRKQAILKLCAGMSARLKTATLADSVVLDAVLRVGTELRDDLSARGTAIPEDLRNEMAGFGGDMAAWTIRQIKGGKLSQISKDDADDVKAEKKSTRKTPLSLASVGETVVFFAQRAAGADGKKADLQAALDTASKEGDARAVDRFSEVLVKDVLAKPPFALASDRFLK